MTDRWTDDEPASTRGLPKTAEIVPIGEAWDRLARKQYDEALKERIAFHARGHVEPTLSNACTVLQFHRAWWEVFAYDTFSQSVVLDRPPPIDRPNPDAPWDDVDYDRVRRWFGDALGCHLTATDAQSAVAIVAHGRPVHAVARYLDRVERAWDGVPRIDSAFVRFFGAIDDPFVRAAGRRWMIAAVARARSPGCQVDTMIVLEDPVAGVRKSSGLRALATGSADGVSGSSARWFTDHLGDIEGKPADVANQLNGVWIVEIPEMVALQRCKNAETIKAFLSQRVERHVHKWKREASEVPRSCVFAGTTQTNNYLRGGDNGEARRFHPIEIIGRVDTDGLEAYRDQLWGEAAAAHRAGEPWWFVGGGPGEAEARIRSAGRSEDPFTAIVRDAVAGYEANGVRLEQVMTAVYGGGDEREDGTRTSVRGWGSDREHRRVVNALRMIGWVRTRVRFGTTLAWLYKPQKS